MDRTGGEVERAFFSGPVSCDVAMGLLRRIQRLDPHIGGRAVKMVEDSLSQSKKLEIDKAQFTKLLDVLRRMSGERDRSSAVIVEDLEKEGAAGRESQSEESAARDADSILMTPQITSTTIDPFDSRDYAPGPAACNAQEESSCAADDTQGRFKSIIDEPSVLELRKVEDTHNDPADHGRKSGYEAYVLENTGSLKNAQSAYVQRIAEEHRKGEHVPKNARSRSAEQNGPVHEKEGGVGLLGKQASRAQSTVPLSQGEEGAGASHSSITRPRPLSHPAYSCRDPIVESLKSNISTVFKNSPYKHSYQFPYYPPSSEVKDKEEQRRSSSSAAERKKDCPPSSAESRDAGERGAVAEERAQRPTASGSNLKFREFSPLDLSKKCKQKEEGKKERQDGNSLEHIYKALLSYESKFNERMISAMELLERKIEGLADTDSGARKEEKTQRQRPAAYAVLALAAFVAGLCIALKCGAFDPPIPY